MSDPKPHTHYRGFLIEYNPKPVPASLAVDWDWIHPDFDGGPWETGGPPMDSRCGNAASEQACRDAIDEWYEEHPDA